MKTDFKRDQLISIAMQSNYNQNVYKKHSEQISIFTEALMAEKDCKEKKLMDLKRQKSKKKFKKEKMKPNQLHLVNLIERRFVIKKRDEHLK